MSALAPARFTVASPFGPPTGVACSIQSLGTAVPPLSLTTSLTRRSWAVWFRAVQRMCEPIGTLTAPLRPSGSVVMTPPSSSICWQSQLPVEPGARTAFGSVNWAYSRGPSDSAKTYWTLGVTSAMTPVVPAGPGRAPESAVAERFQDAGSAVPKRTSLTSSSTVEQVMTLVIR